jgi:hypothetical protein
MSYSSWVGNNAANARLEFENAKIALIASGLSRETVESAALTQSYLRLEQPLTTGITNINFPVLNNQTGNSNAIRATEKRLKLQDAFYVSGVEIYICKAPSATSTAMVLSTYPNAITFPTGSAALATFYNGYYAISVNNTIIVPAYPLMNFLQVPETQLTGATNSPIDEFSGSDRMALQPNPVFIGQKDTQFVITMPGPITALDANVYVVVMLQGVLAQNVTVVS